MPMLRPGHWPGTGHAPGEAGAVVGALAFLYITVNALAQFGGGVGAGGTGGMAVGAPAGALVGEHLVLGVVASHVAQHGGGGAQCNQGTATPTAALAAAVAGW